jgi:hypothetical protein
MDGFGKKTRVMSFLAAEAEATHFGFGELEKARRCEWLHSFLKTLVQSAGGGEGDLLLQDDVDEAAKARLADPERRLAVNRYDAG